MDLEFVGGADRRAETGGENKNVTRSRPRQLDQLEARMELE